MPRKRISIYMRHSNISGITPKRTDADRLTGPPRSTWLRNEKKFNSREEPLPIDYDELIAKAKRAKLRTEDLRTRDAVDAIGRGIRPQAADAEALLVWLDVLKEFSVFEVESMLVDMPKRLTKFPAPADVWKACNERRMRPHRKRGAGSQLEQPPRVTSHRHEYGNRAGGIGEDQGHPIEAATVKACVD